MDSEFKGKVGAIIVTLAIIGGLFAGYVMSVEKTSSTGTDYDLVTDVSGLWEYDDTRQYIEYDVSKNYTGYNQYTATIDTSITGSTYSNSTTDNGYKCGWTGSVTYSTPVFFVGTNVAIITNTLTNTGSIYDSAGITNISPHFTSFNLYVSNASTNNVTYTYYGHITQNTTNWGVMIDDALTNTDTAHKMYNTNSTVYFKTDSDIKGILDINGTIYLVNGNTLTKTIDGSTSTFSSIATSLGDGVYSYTQGSGDRLFGSPTVTGYGFSYTPTGSSGISYTVSSQSNNYLVGTGSSATTQSKTLDNYNSVTNLIPAQEGQTINSYVPIKSGYGQSNQDSYYLINGHASTFAAIITSMNLPSTTTTLTITVNHVTQSGLYWNTISFNGTHYTNQNVGINQNPNYTTNNTGMTFSQWDDSTYNWYDAGDPSSITLTYDATSQLISYNGSSYSASDVILYWSNTVMKSHWQIYGSGSYVTVNTTYTLVNNPSYSSWTYTYSNTTYQYMNINEGISIPTGQTGKIARWSNGYDNGLVDIVFHVPDDALTLSNTITLSTGDRIDIEYARGYGTGISINNSTSVNIGQWATFLIGIDSLNGYLTAIPCELFVNYTTFKILPYVVDVGSIAQGDMTHIDWSATSESYKFSVYKTEVFLNTYNAVMKDATLNIDNFFPELTMPRLNFYSFALYGDSVTINGTEYKGVGGGSIHDTGIIVINNKEHTLQNIAVSFVNGHTYIIIDRDTIDTGATTTKDITFDGYWYFTTQLYEGKTVTTENYDWDWGTFSLDVPLFSLLAATLIIIGIVLVKRFTEWEFTIYDWLLLGGCLILALVLAGGLMQ